MANQEWSSQQLQALGKVAVLMGGTAAERGVSLNSGHEVYKALIKAGVDATEVDVTSVEQLIDVTRNFDRAFNVVHGRWGEDGGIQAVMDALGFACTGSGMAASALAMDKLRTKWLWQGAKMPTPRFMAIGPHMPFEEVQYDLGFPVIVKPVREGSSIGMRKVDSMQALLDAIEFAQQYDAEVLVEQWITGAEYTCAILENEALPIIKLETPNEFYDYEAKYQSDETRYLCPSGLSEAKEQELRALSLKAFQIVGAEGWGRIDIMMDQNQQPWLIELNTVPGMTDHSLVPMAAKARGIDFEQLVVKLLMQTL